MDIQYLLLLQGFREATGGVLDTFFQLYSDVGIAILGMAIPLVVFWSIDSSAGMFALLSYGSSSAVNQLIKNTACVYRPWIRSSEVHPVDSALAKATGYSFPSGHMQSATSSMGAIGWWWRKRRGVLIGCVVLIVLMGFSRNYLGVHTPQDVLVACAESIGCIALMWWFIRWVDGAPGRDLKALIACLVITVVALTFLVLKPYPLDYVDGQLLVDPTKMRNDCFSGFGLFVGIFSSWFIDRRKIHYSCAEASIGERVVRAVVGLVVFFVVYTYLPALLSGLMGVWAGKFVSYCVMALVGLVMCPAAFKAVHTRLEAGRG